MSFVLKKSIINRRKFINKHRFSCSVYIIICCVRITYENQKLITDYSVTQMRMKGICHLHRSILLHIVARPEPLGPDRHISSPILAYCRHIRVSIYVPRYVSA